MSAQVVENPDGTFSSYVDDTDVTDMTYEDLVESGVTDAGGADQADDWQDMEESEGDSELFPPVDVPSAGDEDNQDFIFDSDIEPYTSVPSTSNFTPLAWQVNLASARSMGEHYLMYAVRRSYGSGYYLQYYLVRGKSISKSGDTYAYDSCDVYTYYSYSSTVWYEVSEGSGSVSGTSSLVYSDLYFDYVGTDPVSNGYPYLAFVLLVIICVLIMIGGRRRV